MFFATISQFFNPCFTWNVVRQARLQKTLLRTFALAFAVEKRDVFSEFRLVSRETRFFRANCYARRKNQANLRKIEPFFSIFSPRQSIFISKNNKIAQFEARLTKVRRVWLKLARLGERQRGRRECEGKSTERLLIGRRIVWEGAEISENRRQERLSFAIGATRMLGCYTNDVLCGKSVENVLKRGGELVFFSKKAALKSFVLLHKTRNRPQKSASQCVWSLPRQMGPTLA